MQRYSKVQLKTVSCVALHKLGHSVMDIIYKYLYLNSSNRYIGMTIQTSPLKHTNRAIDFLLRTRAINEYPRFKYLKYIFVN